MIGDFLQSGSIISHGEGKVTLGWSEQAWSQGPNPHSDVGFYFPDFFLSSDKPWLTTSKTIEISIEEMIDLLERESCGGEKASSMRWSPLNKGQFNSSFLELQNLFHDHSLEKAVPFVIQSSDEVFDINRRYYALLNMLKVALSYPIFLYGFWNEREGMLGASPELLFHKRGDNLETVACASTSGVDDLQGLKSDPKQQKEHEIVVRGIIESLGKYGEVFVKEQVVLRLPALCHLLTPIELKLKGPLDNQQLVMDMHPTPALGGYPKEEAFQWLKDCHRNCDRKRFGAPVGLLRKNEFLCYVGIRNIQWDETKSYIGAGCGIVLESAFDVEWREIQQKIQSIKSLMRV